MKMHVVGWVILSGCLSTQEMAGRRLCYGTHRASMEASTPPWRKSGKHNWNYNICLRGEMKLQKVLMDSGIHRIGNTQAGLTLHWDLPKTPILKAPWDLSVQSWRPRTRGSLHRLTTAYYRQVPAARTVIRGTAWATGGVEDQTRRDVRVQA